MAHKKRIALFKPEVRPVSVTGVRPILALAAGSAAFGALSAGAVAIGALRVGVLSVGRAKFGRVEIRELVVQHLEAADGRDLSGGR